MEQLALLIKRIESTSETIRIPVDNLAIRLHGQYPGDVGVFCAYLLNYTVLQPGQALFLGANEPHAYISGDCAEIMSASDNVIRAGLTPKWMDVKTLCNCLTYNATQPHYVTAEQVGQGVWVYRPPVKEFMLERVQLASGEQATIGSKEGPSIIIVVKGETGIESYDDGAEGSLGVQSRLSTGAVQIVSPRTILRLRAQAPMLLFCAS